MVFATKYLYRSAGMGDVLWTEPLIRTLAAGNKRIVLFTQFPELFNNYPLLNVSVKKIPPGWYRAILKTLNFFTGNKTYYKLDGVYEALPKMHMLHAYQRHFSIPVTNVYPCIYLNENEKKPVEGMPLNYAVLHLENKANLNYRNVYGVDWDEVAGYFQKKNIAIVVAGINPESVKGSITFTGTVRQLIQLIYNAKYFIGVDSGPGHIAACLKIPALIFFGSVNPAFRHFPELFNGYILQQPCEFAGCYHEVIGGRGQSCKLVGDSGIPKCCINTTGDVIKHLELLSEKNFNDSV